ncbi:hypothetical protein SKAU_G00317540 [Synaphobranchus kaupii]|uniref:Uncharacterized protein n=1 Tax=Synaphobranchus kaupii TaxID=118154 RepID=A0A9Q1ILZ9_SYNKA|nr:hypothetical protein SKAU_G00317540 [Synaphobranchus kaupii]
MTERERQPRVRRRGLINAKRLGCGEVVTLQNCPSVSDEAGLLSPPVLHQCGLTLTQGLAMEAHLSLCCLPCAQTSERSGYSFDFAFCCLAARPLECVTWVP